MRNLVRRLVPLAGMVVVLAGARFFFPRVALAADGASGDQPQAASSFAGVLTFHNDNARTGQNLNETILTPGNVNQEKFGQLFTDPVDGYLYAQPLYLPGVAIPGNGIHNVIYAASQNDSVYAFDADSAGLPLWQLSFIDPPSITTLGPSTLPSNCTDTLQVGITSTPVIDPSTGTLYLVAKTLENGTPLFRLHALDVTSGVEKFNGPIVITGSVVNPVNGGTILFDPTTNNQRQALALVNGTVYLGFSSYCDSQPYHGWLLGYAVVSGTLTQTLAFSDTPNGSQGGIWQSGGGPAADSSGNLYESTGNGTFDADSGGPDYGMSVVKFTSGTLTPVDYFSPYDEETLSSVDQDLGSAGILLLPDQTTSIPHLMVTSDKSGILFLINRDNLGHFVSVPPDQIVQEVTGQTEGLFSTPTYWNGSVYLVPSGDSPKAFSLVTVKVNGNSVTNLSSVPTENTNFNVGFPGATASISANGNSGGVLWFISRSGGTGGDARLVALNPTNIGTEFYDSDQANGGRDLPGLGVKFATPTVANGKVYVGTQTQLAVYGLLPSTITASPSSLSFGSVSVHARSKPQSIRVRNGGGATVTGIEVASQAPFSITTTCRKPLAVGALCAVEVVFGPTAVGAVDKTLTIDYSGGTTTVSMSGTGAAAAPRKGGIPKTGSQLIGNDEGNR